MIVAAGEYHKEYIIWLWNKAFGDKAEDVEKYLNTILKYFKVYEEDGIIKGILSVLPVSVGDKRGGYIYAVTTRADCRGQGICNKLMDFVKADKIYDFLVLKPQNDGLFDFYAKMGFEKAACVSKKEILRENSETEYKLTALSPQEYKTARKQYIGDEIIEWNTDMLDFARGMYNGEFYSVEKDGKSAGIAFLYRDENKAVIKELLSEENHDIVNYIAKRFDCEKAEVTYCDSDGDIGFMIYPNDIKRAFFNIYFD